MTDHLKFYIDGQWVDPIGTATLDVINPATEEVIASVAEGDAADVDLAAKAANLPHTVGALAEPKTNTVKE